MSAQGLMLSIAGSGVYSHETAITNLNAGSGDEPTIVYGYLDREDGLIEPTYFTLSSDTGLSRNIFSAYYQPYTSSVAFGCYGQNIYGDTISNAGWSTVTIINATTGVLILRRVDAYYINYGYEAQWTWDVQTGNPFPQYSKSQIRFN